MVEEIERIENYEFEVLPQTDAVEVDFNNRKSQVEKDLSRQAWAKEWFGG